MKAIKKCWLVLVVGFSVLFVKAESQGQGTQPIGSYSKMQKKVGYPTPTKEQLQKMLQKFVGELEGRAFKEFSETDFNHGCLLYDHEDKPGDKPADNALRAILWYTQTGKIFDKEMRSWYQRYGGDKTFAATNANGMTSGGTFGDDFWFPNLYRDTGIVTPGMLRTREVGYIDINFAPTKKRMGDARPNKPDTNLITVVVGGKKKVELVVTFATFLTPK